MKTLELLSRIEDEYSATGDLGITTLQLIRGAIEELQQAQTAPVVPDTDLLKRVVDVAAMLYREWENGVPCYEDPDDSTGYLGNAFKLDDGSDDRCVRIITEAEAYLSAAPSAPIAANSEDAKDTAIVGMFAALTKIDSIMQCLYEGGFRVQMHRAQLPDRREFEKLLGFSQTWLRYADTIKASESAIAATAQQKKGE